MQSNGERGENINIIRVCKSPKSINLYANPRLREEFAYAISSAILFPLNYVSPFQFDSLIQWRNLNFSEMTTITSTIYATPHSSAADAASRASDRGDSSGSRRLPERARRLAGAGGDRAWRR